MVSDRYHQGKWLRARIDRTGRSVSEFARIVGMSREHLQRSFNDAQLRMRRSQLWRVLDALKLTDIAIALGHTRQDVDDEHDRYGFGDVFSAEMMFSSLMRLDRFGELNIEGARKSRDRLSAAVGKADADDVEVIGAVDEIPIFNLTLAAGALSEVPEGLMAQTPAQRKAGVFRVRLRGDSMEKKYPNGSIVEFKVIEPDIDNLSVGKDYYVQTAEGATFKRLVKHGDIFEFRAINRKTHPKPIKIPAEEIVNMAKAEFMMQRV